VAILDLFVPIVRAWTATLRWSTPADLPSSPTIYACWHSDLVAAGAFFRPRPVTALVSRSSDGDVLVEALGGRKLSFVRGSSSQGGGAGARACLRILGSGRSVATTWDGPKGPPGVAKRGPRWMARSSGAQLVDVRFRYQRRFQLGDWSRMSIPFPFSRVVVEFRPCGSTE